MVLENIVKKKINLLLLDLMEPRRLCDFYLLQACYPFFSSSFFLLFLPNITRTA